MESAFGRASPGVTWACGRLAARVCTCLRHLHAQPPAAEHALRLLLLLAYWKDTLSQCDEFRILVEWEIAGNNLSGDLKRPLYKAFALVSREAQGLLKTRLVESTMALQDKLNTLKNMDLDTEPVRNMLASILDCFIGFNDGFLESESMDQQFCALVDAIEKTPAVLFKYHNYPAVVLPALELLSASARKMIVSVDARNKTKYLGICNTTFEVYQRWNSGKLTHIPHDAEEEAYDDICSLMEIVCKVGRFAPDAAGGDTVARGLRVLFPLITPSLLAVPTLAHHAYKMLRSLEGSDQLTSLPIEDFNTVVSALRVGLTSISSDVSSVCCNTIAGLADKLTVNSPYAMPLLSLAEILLMLIIKMEMPSDCIPTAGAAIYALTCLKPALLEGLARQMIEAFAVNDPANVPKLEGSFAILTNGVLFDRHRPHRIRFQDNFDKFLSSVHGFLLVK